MSEGVQRGLAIGMDQFEDHFASRIENMGQSLERAAEVLSKAAGLSATVRSDGGTSASYVAVETTFREATTELHRLVEQSRQLVESFNRIQPTQDVKKNDGFFRRFLGG